MESSTKLKNLKIANILRRFTFSEWGGTETVVWNTAKELKSTGNTPDIICTKALDKRYKEVVDDLNIERYKYFYPYIPLRHKQKLSLDKKGGNPISIPIFNTLLKKKYDILHCHTMGHLGNSVYLASKIKKIPYVVSLHGGYTSVPDKEVENIMSPTKGSFHYGKFCNAFFGRDHFMDKADGIICVGHEEYVNLIEKYPAKKVIYLPNGVDLNSFNNHKVDFSFRKKYQIEDSAKVLLCVSRIDHQKNQLLLLDMLKKINDKNIYLVVVGPVTSEEYFIKFQNRVKELSLDKNVIVIKGLKPHSSELLEIYLSSDLFILPSIHEPFGIVILEAWASGLPVVASCVGGIKKLVDDNKTGLLFESESLDDLTNKVKTLLNDSDLSAKFIKNSMEEIENKYTWSTITDKLKEFYYELLQQKRF